MIRNDIINDFLLRWNWWPCKFISVFSSGFFQERIHFFFPSVTFIELQTQMVLVTQKITRNINFRQKLFQTNLFLNIWETSAEIVSWWAHCFHLHWIRWYDNGLSLIIGIYQAGIFMLHNSSFYMNNINCIEMKTCLLVKVFPSLMNGRQALIYEKKFDPFGSNDG